MKKMQSRAVDWIGKNRKGKIWREFPGGRDGKYSKMTLEEIKKDTSAAGKKAWKLLNDKRFAK